MDRPRLLMLIHKFSPFWGGADSQLRQLTPRLRDQGWEVEIITRRWQSNLARTEMLNGVLVRRLGIAGTHWFASIWFAASLFWLLLRQRGPCVVHTHGSAVLGSLAGLGAAVRSHWTVALIATPQRLPAFSKKWWARLLLPWLRRCDAAISISREIRQELQDAGVSSERIVDIPLGVDLDRFAPCPENLRSAKRESLNLDPTALLVVFSGRLVYQKGLDTLAEAWLAVERAIPNAWLVILGSGAGFDDPIERKSRDILSRGNAARVEFVGQSSHPEEYLSVGDAFVFPSRFEGLPNALLEAMAAGLPCVASHIPGVTDLMQDGVEGLLTPVENAAQLANNLIRLLSEPAARRSFATAARSAACKTYSWARITALHEVFYTSLISQPPSSGWSVGATEVHSPAVGSAPSTRVAPAAIPGDDGHASLLSPPE